VILAERRFRGPGLDTPVNVKSRAVADGPRDLPHLGAIYDLLTQDIGASAEAAAARG